MLYPKKQKFLKSQKGKNKGISLNGNSISFGEFGLKSLSRGKISSNQIESGRKVLSRYLKKNGKIWIRIFPDKPVTKKPLEVRMGNGKGDVDHYVYEVRPGKIIYEINGISENFAKKIFKLTSHKLPLKTDFCKF